MGVDESTTSTSDATDSSEEPTARQHAEGTTRGEPSDARDIGVPRRLRSLPTAATPVTTADLLAGVAEHARGRGRDQFRRDLQEFLQGDSAGTYSSYRRALAAGFRELDDASDGTETTVLVPAFCSSDFASAIHGVGLDVRRYDVRARTLATDVDSLRARRTDDVLAVVTANVLGYSSDLASIAAFCEENDLFLVETLGYALGATYDGRRLGTYGDLCVLNFQQGKPIPVGGGMVVGRHPALSFGDDHRPAAAPNALALAGYSLFAHPRPYDVYDRIASVLRRNGTGIGSASTHPESKTDVTYDGAFPTMSNFQGAVATRVRDRLPETRRKRARTAQYYQRAFESFEFGQPITPLSALANHQWVRFPLLVESNELRGELRRTLEKHGVKVPLLYNWPKVRRREFPGARTLQRRILPLPTHPYVDDRDREHIVDVIHHVADAYADRL